MDAHPTKPIVSVITPCYNGERFIRQWADSLVVQDYPCVEVIFVNDGSTDGSAASFLRESERLRQRGYCVRYINKANGGAADAVNAGLKLVTGEYVMLFDIDDILFPEAISAKADFLTENADVDIVRNNGYMVREVYMDDRSTLIENGANRFNAHQFDDYLHMRILPYPGSYMVRAQALFLRLTDRSIYVSDFGQNLQILIPLAYFGKTGYIDRPLMKYVNYIKSHSHTKNFNRRLELYNGFEGNVIGTLLSMDIPEDERNRCIETVRKANLEGRFFIGIEYGQRKLIREQYREIMNQGLLTAQIRWMYLISHLPLCCFVMKNIPRVKRALKRAIYKMIRRFLR